MCGCVVGIRGYVNEVGINMDFDSLQAVVFH